jgi:hypothetical protein
MDNLIQLHCQKFFATNKLLVMRGSENFGTIQVENILLHCLQPLGEHQLKHLTLPLRKNKYHTREKC